MVVKATKRDKRGSPTWAISLDFPRQGDWTEDDYFAIEGKNNRLKELCDGFLEVLPMPTLDHQEIVRILYDALRDHLRSIHNQGKIYFAPCPIRFSAKLIREPDLFYLSATQYQKRSKYATTAELVIEVVSGTKTDRQRDLVIKRKEYAEQGVKEYWIVDPKTKSIQVLSLPVTGKKYQSLGKFTGTQSVKSKVFPGLVLAVGEVFGE